MPNYDREAGKLFPLYPEFSAQVVADVMRRTIKRTRMWGIACAWHYMPSEHIAMIASYRKHCARHGITCEI